MITAAYPWTGSWTGRITRETGAMSVMTAPPHGIRAGSALAASGRASRNAPLASFDRRLRFVVATYWRREVASRRWV
jgi:hypothetical protein